MPYLTAALLTLAFTLGAMSAQACSKHEQTASEPATVASAEKGTPASTKIRVPETKPPQS